MKKNYEQELIALRADRSQEETAKALGVSLERYQGYEDGSREPSDEMKVKIAELYGVTVKELFYLEPVKHRGRDMMELAAKIRHERRHSKYARMLEYYDLSVGEIARLRELRDGGVDPVDIILAAFDYGFILGHRATKKGYKEGK